MYSLQFFIIFRIGMPPYPSRIGSALAFAPSASSCPQKGPHFPPWPKRSTFFTFGPPNVFFGVTSLHMHVLAKLAYQLVVPRVTLMTSEGNLSLPIWWRKSKKVKNSSRYFENNINWETKFAELSSQLVKSD